jgi:Glycosyltransferase family 87
MNAATLPRHRVVIVALFVCALYALLTFGVYAGLTSHVLGANDFYSRWEGARAFLLDGANPYSDAVTREIQIGMYGRLALPSEDQVAFAYPFYVIFPIAPFVALPYALAQAFWMALLILAVFGGAAALIHFYRLKGHPVLLMVLPFGALLFYPSVRGIFNGQITLLSFFFITFALWAIGANADVAAGFLLALATIKPQPAVLLVPIVLIWAWRQRRMKIVASTLGALGGFVGVALLLVPTWFLDFLEGLRRYTQYEPIGPPIQILGEYIFRDGWSWAFTVAASLALLGWLFVQAARSLDKSWANFQTTIGLAALVSTLMAGRMGTPDQLLLLIPWAQWLGAWLRDGERRRAVFAGLGLLILPWFIFLITLRGNAEHLVVGLVLPFLSLAVYLWQSRRVDCLPRRQEA